VRWVAEPGSFDGKTDMPRIIKIALSALLVVGAVFVLRAYYLSRTRFAAISGETQRGLKPVDDRSALYFRCSSVTSYVEPLHTS